MILNNEKKNLCAYSYSLASASHKIFFSKYNDKNITTKLKKSDEEFIREGYFGGRCEVFGNIREKEHIKYFDFPGMYAQCMLGNFHNGPCSYTANGD